tara:strand:- start:194 stop:424 length:231 start_codon:yes stop_codon:yes gene_type:complete
MITMDSSMNADNFDIILFHKLLAFTTMDRHEQFQPEHNYFAVTWLDGTESVIPTAAMPFKAHATGTKYMSGPLAVV